MSVFPLKIPKRPTTFPLKMKKHTIGCINSYTDGIVGVKKDGTVYTIANSSNFFSNASLVKDVISVHGAGGSLLLLKKDGTVTEASTRGWDLTSLNNIVDIYADNVVYCALKSDGTVISNAMSCGLPTPSRYYPEIVKYNDIIQISASAGSSITILRKDGTVVSYGGFSPGLTTNGLVTGFDDIVQITSNYYDLLGLKSNGTVVSLNKNNDTYKAVSKWNNIVKIDSRHGGVAGLKSDGTVVTTSNELNAKISSWNNIVDVLIGTYNIWIIGLKSDGSCLFATTNGSNDFIAKTLIPTLSSWNIALPSIDKKGLLIAKNAINLLNKSKVKGFTINGIQPANTNRKVAFKVDNKWNKLTTNGVLSPLPTQAITSDSVLAEGNTVSELTALTNVPSFVGKMVYPVFALYASNEATAMPTIGMTVKAEIDTTSTSTSTNYTYAYTDYSQEFELSKDDNIDVRLISVACKTTLKGNGTVNITARIKQNDTWSDYQSLDKIQLTLCSAVQLKYDYKVAVTDGTDSAKVDEVVIKYNNSGAITSHLETDIVTVTEKFTNDLAYAHAYIKHAPLVDAEMKVYCAIRKRPKRRGMYQFANGTGALHTYTLPDSGVNHDTLRIYVDNKKLMDFDYNTKTSEVTFTAEKGTVLSATYEYGWEKSEWYEMNLVNTQINDSGTYTTEYDYIVPSHEGDYTVTAIKYHLIRPEGKVTNAVIGVGTGRKQIIRLPHYAKPDTIVCNVIWSYDYDSKCITVIAPEGDNIVISYDWIAESPQVYGVMAGWAD